MTTPSGRTPLDDFGGRPPPLRTAEGRRNPDAWDAPPPPHTPSCASLANARPRPAKAPRRLPRCARTRELKRPERLPDVVVGVPRLLELLLPIVGQAVRPLCDLVGASTRQGRGGGDEAGSPKLCRGDTTRHRSGAPSKRSGPHASTSPRRGASPRCPLGSRAMLLVPTLGASVAGGTTEDTGENAPSAALGLRRRSPYLLHSRPYATQQGVALHVLRKRAELPRLLRNCRPVKLSTQLSGVHSWSPVWGKNNKICLLIWNWRLCRKQQGWVVFCAFSDAISPQHKSQTSRQFGAQETRK